MINLILYSKPGCHLCEGLQEKLEQVQSPAFQLTIRDITTRADWQHRYQYEIPVLCWVEGGPEAAVETPLPRLSPRSSIAQVAQMLQKYCPENRSE